VRSSGILERRAAERRAGAGRGEPRGCPTRCGRLRCWRPAGRIAQIVALPRGRHLPRRVWLFLHGYEIAGGLGVKLALPEREVWVLVGDGSYLTMNSEIATSVLLDRKLNIVVLDNGGFGCIDRLQRSCGGASFNNLFPEGPRLPPHFERDGNPAD